MRDIRSKARRIAIETAQLPLLDLIAKPVYRRLFQRPYQDDNRYYGVYDNYEQARADAPTNLPSTYDTAAAGRLYRSSVEKVRASDYVSMHWLSRLLAAGQRRVFDLGGHIGISYYGFARYLDYPTDMRWTVHDVASVMAAGQAWAVDHDPSRRLAFAEAPEHADGFDVLFTSGALQYLEYSLADLLKRLQRPPPHVLVNVVPMHPERSYFTLQNIGIAICPYRVSAVPEFVAEMEQLGYHVADRWDLMDRHLEVPFASGFDIDRYYGFYFRRDADAAPAVGHRTATHEAGVAA